MSTSDETSQPKPNGHRKFPSPSAASAMRESTPEASNSSEMTSSVSSQTKPRSSRRTKPKFSASGKNARNHENGHHSGSDQGQTSRCSLCNLVFYNNPPFSPSSWLRIVYETIRLLHDEGIPHRKYFHYKHDICNFIDRNWAKLCPDKKRTITWNNTVSAVITTHRKLFKSNTQQSGFWTLMPPPGTSSANVDGESDEENVDYVEKAREMKVQSRSAAKMKKRKFGEVSTTPRSIPISKSSGSPVSYYKAYFSDGPITKIRKTHMTDIHRPKPNDWRSPTPIVDPNSSDLPYIPISVRRRSRPPNSSYFNRVHARLQATTDPRTLSELTSSHSVTSSHSSLASSSHSSSILPRTSFQNSSFKTETTQHSPSTNGVHLLTPPHGSNAMDVTSPVSISLSFDTMPTGPTRPFTLSMAPPSPRLQSIISQSSSSSSKSHKTSSLVMTSPGTRQAKIIAASNLMAATAGLNSGTQSPILSRVSNSHTYISRGDNPTPTRPPPQVLDPVIIPLPCGWFEKSFIHPSVRKRSSNQDIPLPVWKELDEQEERQYWEAVKSEPDDEDISDVRFIVQHKEYEKEEKKLKKLCS